MPDLFGWAGGLQQADRDNQAQLINALNAQRVAGQIAMQPTEARQATASADLTESQAATAKQALLVNQKIAEAQAARRAAQPPAGAVAANPGAGGMDASPVAGAIASGSPVSAAAPLEQAAQDAYDAGGFTQGTAYATKAAAIRKDEAAARASAATTTTKQLEAVRLQSNIAGSLVADAKTPQDLIHAATVFKNMTGTDMGLTAADLADVPATVKKVQDHALSTKEKAELDLRTHANATKDAEAAAIIAERRARLPLIKAQTGVENERLAMLAKHDGIPNLPPEKDIQGGTKVITDAFPDMDKAEARLHGTEVANRAKGIIAGNPGISYDVALNQAFTEQKQAGGYQNYLKALDTSPAAKSTRFIQTLAGPGATPEDISNLRAKAAQAATGQPLNQVVPGYGKNPFRDKVSQAAAQLLKDGNPGMTDEQAGAELAQRGIDYAAGKRSVTQLNTMLGSTKQAVDQLDFNVDKASEKMAGLTSSDLSPIINAIARGEEKWTGNPKYSGLYYYMQAAATESARILSGGQASAAQLHEGAAKEAQKWASVNMTPASWIEVSRDMKDEGKKRVQTYQDAIKSQGVSKRATTTPASGDAKPTVSNW